MNMSKKFDAFNYIIVVLISGSVVNGKLWAVTGHMCFSFNCCK